MLGSLVALAILLVAIVAAYPFMSSVMLAFRKASSATSASRELSDLHAAAKKATSRIRPPFWTRYKAAGSGSSCEFPWFDGVEESVLSVTIQDGAVEFEAPGFQFTASASGIDTVLPLEGQHGVVKGIILSGERNGQPLVIEAAFSSFPFSGEIEP